MAWVILVAAGLLETVWALAMKRSNGFSEPVPTVVTLAVATASVWLLSIAARSLPLGTAYAAWTGIGAVSTLAVGIVALGEPATPLRLGSAAFIVLGLIGLRLAGSE